MHQQPSRPPQGHLLRVRCGAERPNTRNSNTNMSESEAFDTTTHTFRASGFHTKPKLNFPRIIGRGVDRGSGAEQLDGSTGLDVCAVHARYPSRPVARFQRLVRWPKSPPRHAAKNRPISNELWWSRR